MWLAVLSDQLRVIALVSHYLTNKLIMACSQSALRL